MIGTLGNLSREFRETILLVMSPIPLISAFLIAFRLTTGSTLVFILLYSGFLACVLLFVRRAYSMILSSIKNARKFRVPDVPIAGNMGIWEQAVLAKNEYFRMDNNDLQHISEYQNESIVPRLTYVVISSILAITSWIFVSIIIGIGISAGVHTALIGSINESTVADLSQIVGESTTVVAIVGNLFFPDVGLETAVILFVDLLLPFIIFLTAIENFISITEELGRRFLQKFYNSNSRFRKYEITGWFFLALLFASTLSIAGMT